MNTWELLPSFGFVADEGVYSDIRPGYRLHCGPLELMASCVLGKHFKQVVLFTGSFVTSRVLAMIEFELPCHIASRELLAAHLADQIDRYSKGRFNPGALMPWLDEGRANRALLPSEIARVKAEQDRAKYDARPRCSIDREWLKLALRRLRAHLEATDDEALISIHFNGETLTFRHDDSRITVAAEGPAWLAEVRVAARNLRHLPQRLMSPAVEVSHWQCHLTIDRNRYPLAPAEESPSP